MKPQALTQWNAMERFLFPAAATARKASVPPIADKGYHFKLSPLPDTPKAQERHMDLPLPAVVEFFSKFIG